MLHFAGVLSTIDMPAIQLVYEDEASNRVYVYAGLLSSSDEPAFTIVPEGHLSLHWRRGPLLFALVTPSDSPQLHEMVRLVSEGLASAPPAPVEASELDGVGGGLVVGRALQEGAVVLEKDIVSRRVIIPMPRPEIRLPVHRFDPDQPLQATPVVEGEPNEPKPL